MPKLAFDLESGRYTTSEWNEYARRLQESGAAKRWMIEVINLSTFALTIDEVGFGDHSEAGNYAMVDPEISRGKTRPVMLEPREKAIFYSTDGTLLPERVWSNPFAYAKTDCGSSFYGQSLVLLEIAKNRSLGLDVPSAPPCFWESPDLVLRGTVV